jgi:SAM-dependent methyltransferase
LQASQVQAALAALSNRTNMATKTLDLGCGDTPKNPFNMDEIYGVDIRKVPEKNILKADLAVERIPFDSDMFDAVSAFDFIEHVPRIIYNPKRRFCFVELMNEIYRVLKPGGRFFSFTPAFPAPAAWRDPTHVNIITEETFPLYFDNQNRLAVTTRLRPPCALWLLASRF